MYLGFFIFFYIFVYNFYYVNANGNNITQSGVPTQNSTHSSSYNSSAITIVTIVFSLYFGISIIVICCCKTTNNNNNIVNENVENIRDLDNIDVRVIDGAERERETETVAVEVPLAYAVKINR
jgi:hypothetical protein